MSLRHLTWLIKKDFIFKLYSKFFETDMLDRAAQVAFYFSFSLFPLLFFLISLFGLLLESTENLRHELFSYLFQIMPRSAYDLVQRTVDEIVESSSTGKLTVGMLITLWSASAGMDSLRAALNSVYQLKETRTWFHTKGLALALTLLSIVLIGLALTIVFYGWQSIQVAIALFGFEVTSPLVLVSLQWITILLLMSFACEVIYNLMPNFHPFRWVWVTPGSIVAILMWIIFTGGFRLYLHYFNAYNKTYGSLGAVIILMLWLYLSAVAVLLGGAINSVLTEMEGPADPKPGGEDSQ